LNENKYEVHFNPGETIFKQGTSLTHIACITEGLVKIYIEGYNRKNLLLKLVRSGEILGGPGLLTDSRHHYTAAAVEDTTTCFIDANFFVNNLKTNNAFAVALITRINTSSISNFERMISYTQKQMPGRTAETLLYLQKKIYKTNPFYLTINRQEMADLASMTKESLIRILKEFKDAGIIEMNGNEVKILNEKALSNISETG
jgi:CRP/FNR family transcriptional regulator